MDPTEELVRLHVLDLRRRLGTQAETIIELRQAGFGPTRIAALLGSNANVVNVTLQKAKKSGKLKRQEN